MANPYSNLATSVMEDDSTSTSGSELKPYSSRQSNIQTSITLNQNTVSSEGREDGSDLENDPPQDLLISIQESPATTRNMELRSSIDQGGELKERQNDNLEESTLIGSVNQMRITEEDEPLEHDDNEVELENDDDDEVCDDSVNHTFKDRPSLDDKLSEPNDTENNAKDDSNFQGSQIINNEPIVRTKIPLSASIMLTKIPLSTTTVLQKLQNTPSTTTATQTQTLPAPQSQEITTSSTERVTIRCIPIGSTPVLHPTIFRISYSQPFSTLIKFITKKLKKLQQTETNGVFCYVNSAFAPAPDECIGELYRAFGVRGELIVSYCNVVAFG